MTQPTPERSPASDTPPIAAIFGMSEAGAALAGGEAGGFWLVTGWTVALAATAAIILRRIDWI